MISTKIIFVTGNENKARVAKAVLGSNFEVICENMGFLESQHEEVDAIAQNKALQAYEKFRLPVITDDTGVYVNEFKDGFPGSLAKSLFDKGGPKVIKRLFENGQNFSFRAVTAFYDGEAMLTSDGVVYGIFDMTIVHETKWKSFYDICKLNGQNTVVSLMEYGVLNEVSQGSIALMNLKQKISSYFVTRKIGLQQVSTSGFLGKENEVSAIPTHLWHFRCSDHAGLVFFGKSRATKEEADLALKHHYEQKHERIPEDASVEQTPICHPKMLCRMARVLKL